VNRRDFQILSRVRLKEAKALLGLGLYDGAYYLAGYSVECAFKACIAKQTKRYDFPDRDLVQVFTHAPRQLLVKAGLDRELNTHASADPLFRTNWDTVLKWAVDSRYNVHRREDADLLIRAVGDRHHGVMTWLKRYW
jgi:HEPN domain-containing protein